ncbi:uncharacterized protein HD556DRAFT_1307003 [Suillus plorans]|uniref:DUF6533 domain-containing protein n=1 Tax=Suillus plorans TaxID=116603 RepID=A0A9P7AT80_9AGAM|nr:uncharacterized protein HD556DRAFT_1307003 [Suillus plorans]KAG1796241.1 hypothetical protein HD556DRAFT_1307003 [Suillus plorans]
MTLVSNDPSWWPTIDQNIFYSYFVVVSCAAVIYDWGLTFAQEVELIWRQRWSMMTVLYLTARYVAIGFSLVNMLISLPTIPKTDVGCLIMIEVINWTNDIVYIILGVIAIARLHAMYQGSRKVLIFLLVVFLAIRISMEVINAIMTTQLTGEEYILSGIYKCRIGYPGDSIFLDAVSWILGTVWEVLTLCLAVWIAVKNYRELRGRPTGGIMKDCFTVLMQTHISYFASFACASFLVVSSLQISFLSPKFLPNEYSFGVQLYICLIQIFQTVQLSVLGPRLILSVREYNAKIVTDSDTGSNMTSIAFQERLHVETSRSV